MGSPINPRSRTWPAAPERTINGNFASNPRVMVHDSLDATDLSGWDPAAFPAGGYEIPNTDNPQRGACLYVGVATTQLIVLLESGNPMMLTGVAAGSFLPILATKIVSMNPIPNAGELVILY